MKNLTKFTLIITFILIGFSTLLFLSNKDIVVCAETFPTSNELQAKIDEASSGSIIEMNGNTSIIKPITIKKNITLKFTAAGSILRNSSNDITCANLFIIDADCTLIIDGNDNAVVIDGGRNESNFNTDTFSNTNFSIFKNKGTLELNGITITNNASKDGGAIFNEGTVTIRDCTISNCTAISGAGFYNKGVVSIYNTLIEDNKSYVYGGAGACDNGSTTTIDNTTIRNNCVDINNSYVNTSYGGGGLLIAGGTVNILNNSTISNCEVKNGEWLGGAIEIISGSLNMQGGEISECLAYNGGAIALIDGSIVLNGTKLSDNSAAEGKASDLYIKKNLNSSIDQISANFSSINQTSIIADGNFVISEGFEIGSGSKIVMNNGLVGSAGIIYVNGNPNCALISIEVNNVSNNQKSVEFVGSTTQTEDLFKIVNKGYKLELVDSALYTRQVDLSYTITFIFVDDDSELLSKVVTSEIPVPEEYFNDAIKNLVVPEGSHIVFKDKDGNEFDKETTVDDDITIYVDFEAEVFTVNFYDGIELVKSLTDVEYGSVMSSEDIPVLNKKNENCSQTPYWVKEGETIAFNFSDDVMEDLELVAYYPVIINFYADDEMVGSITKNYGSTLSEDDLPEIPEKTGYTKTTPYYLGINYESEIIRDAEYYAYYTINTYEVVFMVGEEEKSSQTVNHGDKVNVLDIEQFVPVGHNAEESYWAVEDDPFDKDTLITEDLIIHAVFVPNTYTITYILSYKNNFGNNVEFVENQTINRVWNYSLTKEDIPEFDKKTGYSGEISWQNYENTVTDDLEISGSINKDVLWVKFSIDNNIVSQTNLEYGEKLTAGIPQIPEKIGHTQVEPFWADSSLNIPKTFNFNDEITKNIVLKAVYTTNIYVVTFVLPDKTEKTKNVLHGDKVSIDGIISTNFGEVITFDKSLENITEDQTIYVYKTNVILWAGVGAGGVFLIGATILLIKILKKRKITSLANSRGGLNKRGRPYFGDDDQY